MALVSSEPDDREANLLIAYKDLEERQLHPKIHSDERNQEESEKAEAGQHRKPCDQDIGEAEVEKCVRAYAQHRTDQAEDQTIFPYTSARAIEDMKKSDEVFKKHTISIASLKTACESYVKQCRKPGGE